MDNQAHIRELQEKAFNGDKDALELYNEYVNKGQAPAIRLNIVDTSNHKDMYADSKTFKRSSMFGNFDKDKPKHELSAIEKMMYGYEALKEGEEEQ
ncbi:hypothetical protein ACP2W0_00120 [Pseudobacillus badius]|uniref:hypothetical protein n=1 Tax=Bacillus badius TaxID=1455 RepID=UPI003CEC3F1C